MSSAPTVIPSYGGKMRAASFNINCDVTHARGKQPHACRPRNTRLPTLHHAQEAWEAHRMKRLTPVKAAPPAREVSQGKAEAQEKQNDAKTKTTKSKGDEMDPPGKILAGRRF